MPDKHSDNTVPLKNFLEIPYEELERMNLEAAEAVEKLSPAELEKKYRDYLQKEKANQKDLSKEIIIAIENQKL